MRLPENLRYKLQRDGLARSLAKVLKRLVTLPLLPLENLAKGKKLRLRLSRRFMAEFDATIRYGQLKGVRIPQKSHWGKRDRAAMLFGMYEQEVLVELERLAPRFEQLIDLGAADGYYGVGAVASGLFDRSICYEISKKGQAVIRENARDNKVGDRVEIQGTARPDFYNDLSEETLSKSLLFVDIEGGEYPLMTPELLEAFKRSAIIVELHELNTPEGRKKRDRLVRDAEKHFKVKQLVMGSRNPGQFEELADLNDTERWIICSEGRRSLMYWLVMEPLAEA